MLELGPSKLILIVQKFLTNVSVVLKLQVIHIIKGFSIRNEISKKKQEMDRETFFPPILQYNGMMVSLFLILLLRFTGNVM